MSEQGVNIKSILAENSVFDEIYENSKYSYIQKLLTDNDLSDLEFNKIIKLAFLIFNEQLSTITKGNENWATDSIEPFKKVYYLLRSIELNIVVNSFEEIWGIENIDTKITYFFYLGISGLLSNLSVKVQVDLKEFTGDDISHHKDWGNRVLQSILMAVIFLIRKKGNEDIKNVVSSIETLKELQIEFEKTYLEVHPINQQIGKASNLLGYYHICKMITETASYLLQGYSYERNLKSLLKRHAKYAIQCLENQPRKRSIGKLVYLACLKLYNDCIWTQTGGLSSSIRTLCKTINEKGIIDLLPSQQQAIKNNFLDPASNATILQMPTSAGKTLLAEFSILQTKALIPEAKVIYIVPTKALINQILIDLRTDFKGLNLSIEKSTGAIELDPSESLFLESKIDVLVITPEKFDLLIRKKHPVVEDISLVVVDEAHNLNDGKRGTRLELLLAIIKREKPSTRFLLLTPFIPKKENGEAIKEWLASGKNAIPPIMVSWKPADKIFLGVREYKEVFKADIMPSLYGWDVKGGTINISKPNLVSTAKKERIFEFCAKHFSEKNKNILFLCKGKGTSDKKAKFLYDNLELADKNSYKIDLVTKYIDEVIGEPTVLSKILKKGIAVHHAGLTPEIKQLVEHLIREGEIMYICATTTVAQGMNFPISSVYFDTFRKGYADLTVSEFRNIAGRAGRTLIDNIGKIIFPFNSKTNEDKAKFYLESDAEEITSALLDLILSSEEIINAFSSKENSSQRSDLFRNNEALSSLIQYIVHLLNVVESDLFVDELEELFKDSLGYYISNKSDKDKFIKICKRLYFYLQETTSKGILTYADKTGFSVPSVLSIMQSKSSNPEIADLESWKPNVLFNETNTEPMTEKISVIGHLQEVKLGSESSHSPFNPEIVAKILINWVNGDDISSLSKLHPYYKNMESGRINDFISYLTQTTFKSSWGLSALEGIVKSKNDDIDETNSYIPSMVYYGVKSKEAIALRMLGIPRVLSDNLAESMIDSNNPQSFDDVRERVKKLSNSDWEKAKPPNSTLNGKEWKQITEILIS